MKALSLIQPWATLIAIGAKSIETRSWPTKFRGTFAVHASKGFPADCRELCFTDPFFSILLPLWNGDQDAMHDAILRDEGDVVLPRGAVIATARLVKCMPTIVLEPNPVEKAFGDYAKGRFGYVLDDVFLLPRPVVAQGALGFWDMTPDASRTVEELRRSAGVPAAL